MLRWPARLLPFVGVVVVVVLIRCCAFTTYLIPSRGMENTLLEGECILVSRWSYGLRLPLMQWWGYHRWGEQAVGRQEVVVFNAPTLQPGDTTPVIDQQNIYIGRCMGLPGDTLTVDERFRLVTDATDIHPDRKMLYVFPVEEENTMVQLLNRLSLPPAPTTPLNDSLRLIALSSYEHYLLEQEMPDSLCLEKHGPDTDQRSLHRLVVPRRGQVIKVEPWNATLLANTLAIHEGRTAHAQNGKLYLNGRETTHCIFAQDYHWMVADADYNPIDSRHFGFVPTSHLIGRATHIVFSKQPQGGVRWARCLARIH